MKKELILVLDFGGQYCHLISRRVRDLGVYSEILPFDVDKSAIEPFVDVIRGVILSGGPSSVYDEGAPTLNRDLLDFFLERSIPILGLCYGHQLIAEMLGGKIVPNAQKEFGKTELFVKIKEDLFQGLNDKEIVWMSHGDQVIELTEDFKVYASTKTCPIAAYGNTERNIYGLQFHPEVKHTLSGDKILSNFLFGICQCKGDWQMTNWIESSLEEIKRVVGDDGVILGLSGGVDSSVTAVLLQRALGDNVHPIFVNNGLLRKNEPEEIVSLFRDKLKFNNFHYVDAREEFLNALKDVDDPEKKRRIIGLKFVEIFERVAEELKSKYNNIRFLGQGTIFPDRVESAKTSKVSSKIKTHHNTVMPKDMKLKLIEPLKDLYKDEVRKIGLKLGLPENIVYRQPFPGPGLAVRYVGPINEENLELLREADSIVREEIEKAGLHKSLWQYFAVFLPVKNVGVMGDFRTYNYICAVRIVESIDAMTANFAKIDWNILERISTRIINEVKGFNRVVYDISNKPPSTIEFE
ncbi:MAG: glutamine-hydrolyzing GMP synthase [Promethearchaeota archaeon]